MGINCTKGQRQDPLENIKYVPNLGKNYFTPKFLVPHPWWEGL